VTAPAKSVSIPAAGSNTRLHRLLLFVDNQTGQFIFQKEYVVKRVGELDMITSGILLWTAQRSNEFIGLHSHDE
jgi:hypothetical protein